MNERKRKMIEAAVQAVKCSRCDLPTIEIRAGILLVQNRHHGEVHTNSFSLALIKELIEQSEQQIISTSGGQ